MNNRGTAAPLKAEFEKIRSLSKGKRLEYIWEYYRLTFFLFAFFLFFFFAIGSFLVNGLTNMLFPKDAFSIAFAAPGFSASREWAEGCLESIGYEESSEEFRILTSAPLSDTSDDFRINATVWMANGQPDLFVVNEAGYRCLLELEALADLRGIFPEDPRMVDAFALEVSGTPMTEANGLTEGPVYLCMYADGSGFDRALDVVKFILTEE